MGSKPKVERRRFAGGRAFLSILIPLPFAAAVAYFGTNYLRDYGWSLFVGFPFVVPMISVIIYGAGRDVTLGECLAVGWLWILTAVVVMVMTAFEGLICIIMMLPLAIPIVLLGTAVGYCVAAIGRRSRGDLARVTLLLFAILPTMVGAEHLTAPEPLLFLCETSVEMSTTPEKVWENVVKFSDLTRPPTGYSRRRGLPDSSQNRGHGSRGHRRCEFSTGSFVEPIEVWDEPRLLRFSVMSNPSPMQEWNPLFNVHPPHLDGFLVSKQGQFLLIPLPGGRTLLKGSTLYQHGLWPASYWKLWSQPIIHRIHDRVLRHIKKLAET